MTTLTPERIEEIRKALTKINGSNWQTKNDFDREDRRTVICNVDGEYIEGLPRCTYDVVCSCEDAPEDRAESYAGFIASAPSMISDLLSAYDALSRDGMREALVKAHPAIEALHCHQRQLDEDGVEVGVSRQALDETLAAIDAALSPDAPRPTSELVKRAIDIADRIEHLAYGTMSGTTRTLREAAASLQSLEARNKELEGALTGAVDILSGWVTAIQETGTSWDDWDYWYKQAAYNGNLEAWRKLIDAAALHPATKTAT